MWYNKASTGPTGLATLTIGIALLFNSLVFAAPADPSAKAIVSKRDDICRECENIDLQDNCLIILDRYNIPDLFTATIDEIQDGFECGVFSSVQLTMAYIARITEVNSILNVVLEINPDALAIAADLDAQRAAGNVIGPLHGIPILIKDNIATMDKMNNTAGSFSLLHATVPADSTMAANLRKAGAIILGKTNLSQWANYRSSNSTNGWTSRGGQTFGAYYPREDPSGSSSGSAVSSSIGLAMACLGTETSGSIISPSSRNNLVGIKPTVGLTSRYLVIPISSTQDTVGVRLSIST
jgi:amidase